MSRSRRPVDMTHAVLNYSTTRPYGQVRMYGAGACEAADERLLEEVRARRLASNQAKARRQVIANQKAHDESAENINKQLAELRSRRQFLEDELKKNKAEEAALLRKAEQASEVKKKVGEMETVKEEKERRRKAAFKAKKKEMGAKPTGITKVVAAKQPAQKAPLSMLRKYRA